MSLPSVTSARILVDELAGGVRHAVLAPGSRSAPLARALAEHPNIDLRVTLDERSAAFIALGIAKASDAAVVVLTTSGTAAANLFPAIQEAHHARVPLIALTADRPPELRHTGANQTIDQIKLFGDAVRWFVEVGEAADDRYLRSLAGRAIATALGSPAGPVHLNVALREPLTSTDPPGHSRRASTTSTTSRRRPPPSEADIASLATELSQVEEGAVVCGPAPAPGLRAFELARALGWPLLADPLSNQRTHQQAISAYDAILRCEDVAASLRPRFVLRVGALGISKALARWVRTGERQVLVDRDGWWLDPDRSLHQVITCEPAALFEALAARCARPAGRWLERWQGLDDVARRAQDDILDRLPEPSEPRLARDLAAHAPAGSNLVVGASMPFRDIEWFARPRSDVTYFGNRGANGIDGFVGSALGIAVSTGRKTFALCGDLTLLHDQNALLMRRDDVDLTFVVPNNEGGGIFSFLPHAEHRNGFEQLFGTPHSKDLSALAGFHGCEHILLGDMNELPGTLSASNGVRILEIRTERAGNVELHRRLDRAVADAISARGPTSSPGA